MIYSRAQDGLKINFWMMIFENSMKVAVPKEIDSDLEIPQKELKFVRSFIIIYIIIFNWVFCQRM